MRWQLGFDHAFGVKSEGLSGGLVLFWNSDTVVSLKSFSKTHIDVFIQKAITGDSEWRFTGFYGDPVRARRRRSWELLEYLRREYDRPWMCAGDFNEILHASEQIGGGDREEWKMEGFRNTIEYCRFMDIGYTGLPYTWNNKQQGSRNIKVRLDRGLRDDVFMEKFDMTHIRHIQTTQSDHCGLLISVNKSEWLQDTGGPRPFRFENMWTKHDRYNPTVESGWVTGAQNLEEFHMALGQMQRNCRIGAMMSLVLYINN
jgi:hypothetical protein